MKIGEIELPAGAGLAPMAGVTDAAMRLLCFEQGAAWAVSEMLSAKGWIYSRGKNRNAVELLSRLPGEGVGGLQLFGREPEYVAPRGGGTGIARLRLHRPEFRLSRAGKSPATARAAP